MDAPVSASSTQVTHLRMSFRQWATGGTSDQGILAALTLKILGLEELSLHESELRDLMDSLALLNVDVLARIPPGRQGELSSRRLIEDFRGVTMEVDGLLHGRTWSMERMLQLSRSDAIFQVKQRIESLRTRAFVHRMRTLSSRLNFVELAVQLPTSPVQQMPIQPELPPKPAVFCGRNALLETIVQELLRPEASHIPILGPGGIGKTSLAAAIVNHDEIKRKFGSSLLFSSCEGAISAEGIVQALVAVLGLQRDSDARRTVFSYLSSLRTPTLLVLDNIEGAWTSEDKATVEDLLARLASIEDLSLIITMRGSIRPAGVPWSDSCCRPLSGLSLVAAREMWQAIAKATDDRLDELLDLLDGLPLAIHLMAHQGQILMPGVLLEAYRTQKTALINNEGPGKHASLAASIELSLTSRSMSQNADAGRLLSAICLLPDGLRPTSIPQALPSIPDWVSSVRALLMAGLAADHNGALRILSPIREYVLTAYPPKEPHLKELQMYIRKRTVPMKTDNVQSSAAAKAIEILCTEFGNMDSVLRHHWKVGPALDEVDALQTATLRLATFSHTAGYGDCTQLLKKAKVTLSRLEKTQGVAECTRPLGHVLSRQDRYEDAITSLQEARDLFHRAKDKRAVAECTRSIGDLRRMQNSYCEAANELEKAESLFAQLSDFDGAATCIQSIGDLFTMMGRPAEAFEKLDQAKAHFTRTRDRLGAAQCMQGMGDVLRSQRRYDDALVMLEQAERAFKEIGNRVGAAQCKRSQGDALRMVHRYPEAIVKLEEAKTVFNELGSRLGVAQCLLIIGSALLDQCKYAEALGNLTQARLTFIEIGNRQAAADCACRLHHILVKMDKSDEACDMLSEALNVYDSLGLKRNADYCRQILASHKFSETRSIKFADGFPGVPRPRKIWHAMLATVRSLSCRPTPKRGHVADLYRMPEQ